MKGTLFSADFIKDSSDTLRLLELNTDTAIVPDQIDDVNWTPFINTLTSQSISDLHVIYKPVIHNELVNALSSSFSSVSGSTFTKYAEDRNTIYPTTVVDSSDKFLHKKRKAISKAIDKKEDASEIKYDARSKSFKETLRRLGYVKEKSLIYNNKKSGKK